MSYEAELSVLALVVGFPILLMLLMLFLGRIENWMLMPDERAAAVSQLLEQVDETEELEKAVAVMMSDVADGPGERPRSGIRGRAVRLARRRRRA